MEQYPRWIELIEKEKQKKWLSNFTNMHILITSFIIIIIIITIISFYFIFLNFCFFQLFALQLILPLHFIRIKSKRKFKG